MESRLSDSSPSSSLSTPIFLFLFHQSCSMLSSPPSSLDAIPRQQLLRSTWQDIHLEEIKRGKKERGFGEEKKKGLLSS
ncbi:hypothetical protein CKAN_02000000 [Cinnamomum micranthum f. kanehirae]|uniref:Uncharacterized protein n=1 Tax=Cinnamomum micranthum f. kanehirae TaxID=337451 RepID=A0A443PJC5_9MAGN|nr:hypothetical protein CKAN_02000000 [Cinnamomum micranthum f. kanehirae]